MIGRFREISKFLRGSVPVAEMLVCPRVHMSTLSIESGSAILAVDDDRDDTHLLRLLLRKAELPNPVQIYRDGERVIGFFSRLLKQSLDVMCPLLCFLENQTSTISGHEVLRWIRAQPELDHLPVVMLSGSEHPRDIQAAAQAGAQCYLAKYPQPRILQQIVADAERFSHGSPADECFRIPTNLLLVRCRRLNPKPVHAHPLRTGAARPLAGG